MKYVRLLLLLLTMYMVNACSFQTSSLSPDEFEKLLNEQSEIILVDVRTSDEFDTEHIENAINVDFKSDDFTQIISQWDKSKTYLIYCKGGGRSGKAIKKMNKLGFSHVFDLKEGLNTWKEQEKTLMTVQEE